MEKDLTEYESGARKLERRPELASPEIIETGDRADRPKIPYGLTERAKDGGPATSGAGRPQVDAHR